jgi:ParB/RepB/Spo0J family partition protein
MNAATPSAVFGADRKGSAMPLELVDVGVAVPLSKISEIGSAQKVRRETVDQKLDELLKSIKKHGQIHPVSLVEDPEGKYEVANGNRRVLAARKGHLPHVRANIYRVPAGEEENRALLIQQHLYAANMAEPLLPVERARMYETVMSEFEFDLDRTAEMFEGETADSIADTLRFLNIDQAVLDIVAANPGKFTEAHLRVIAEYASGDKRAWRMKPDEQVRIARELVDQTDKQVSRDPRKLETRIKAVVKERRDRESQKKTETKKAQSDPTKALFRAIAALEATMTALVDVDLNTIKAIDPADKGAAIKKVLDVVDALTSYHDDRLSKLPLRKAAA